uniref:Ribosomal RNA processing 1 n=1 Tax=Panthera leo TaxID=9689 RepID=A0A8C8XZ89_PANLE
MGPRVPLPPEIQLAQRLAGNEQVTRDRAVKRLRKYIVARTQRAAGGFTHDELLKVWKGLFYCMWMQDKALLQEELGRTISQLIHAFQTTEAQHLFLQTFWQTMNREWTGIDRLRLDKFYMLMRMVLNESLKALKMQGWEERQAERLLELLTTEILHPDSQAPSGVKSHFLEIFLEELSKVGAAELTADQNLKFIEPFCTIAAQTKDSLVLHNITRGVFETIVEQAPFAIEDLMNELEAAEEEEGTSEDEREEDVPSKEPRRGEGHSTSGVPAPVLARSWALVHGAPGSQVFVLGSSARWVYAPVHGGPFVLGSLHGAAPDTSEEPAGDGEDSMGPVLQFDYEAVASRLFAAASQQDTPSQNRKRLYKVIRKLQDLAEGLFPEDDVPEKACRNLQEDRRERKTKKRLPKSGLQNKAGRIRALVGARKRRRRRQPRAGARAKVTDCQDLRMRRRQPPRSGK